MGEQNEYLGYIAIDKPQGFTSFDVIAKMRGMLKTRRLGHTGTLDPMATGVLVVLAGRATKLSDILPDSDKTYRAGIKLGIATDTQDIWGKVLKTSDVNVNPAQLEETLKLFAGEQMQLPPMYSAIKIGGRPLYDLARKGEIVERVPRKIAINAIELAACYPEKNEYEFIAECSKGTYIRTLCFDIGEKLGCHAAMSSLRRTKACGVKLESCITFEELATLVESGRVEEAVKPVSGLFASTPRAELAQRQAEMIKNGVKLDLSRVKCEAPEGLLAAWQDESFVGLVRADKEKSELRAVCIF